MVFFHETGFVNTNCQGRKCMKLKTNCYLMYPTDRKKSIPAHSPQGAKFSIDGQQDMHKSFTIKKRGWRMETHRPAIFWEKKAAIN